MDKNQERYHLDVFLRFAGLESALGEGPRKITLHKLRRVRSWPSCEKYSEVYEKRDREAPGNSEVTEEIVLERKETEDVTASDVSPSAENATVRGPSIRPSQFNPSRHRKRSPVPSHLVEGRASKRLLRERLFTSSSKSRLNARLEVLQPAAGRLIQKSLNCVLDEKESRILGSYRGEIRSIKSKISELEDRDQVLNDQTLTFLNQYGPPPSLQSGLVLTTEERMRREATGEFLRRYNPPKAIGQVPGHVFRNGVWVKEPVKAEIALEKEGRCLVKLGCSRLAGHKGLCDISSCCPNRSAQKICKREKGHPGSCMYVVWTCTCGVALGRPHLDPNCPERLARQRARRQGPPG